MNLSLFPDEYKRQRDLRMKREIEREKNKSKAKIESITNTLNRVENAPNSMGNMGLYMALGFGVSFLVCGSMCLSGETENALIWFGISGSISLLVGLYAGKKGTENYRNSVEEATSESHMAISAEQNRCAEALKAILKRSQEDSEKYAKEFDKSVQETSVRLLLNSETVRSIADWMTAGFSRMIDVADRSNYIEQIRVPYSFKVYPNKIESPAGVFDFMKERKKPLTGPVEQTALAIAVASAIQTNITTKYPQDKSGTNIIVDMSPYTLECGSAMVGMTYPAPNGNFVRLEDW